MTRSVWVGLSPFRDQWCKLSKLKQTLVILDRDEGFVTCINPHTLMRSVIIVLRRGHAFVPTLCVHSGRWIDEFHQQKLSRFYLCDHLAGSAWCANTSRCGFITGSSEEPPPSPADRLFRYPCIIKLLSHSPLSPCSCIYHPLESADILLQNQDQHEMRSRSSITWGHIDWGVCLFFLSLVSNRLTAVGARDFSSECKLQSRLAFADLSYLKNGYPVHIRCAPKDEDY